MIDFSLRVHWDITRQEFCSQLNQCKNKTAVVRELQILLHGARVQSSVFDTIITELTNENYIEVFTVRSQILLALALIQDNITCVGSDPRRIKYVALIQDKFRRCVKVYMTATYFIRFRGMRAHYSTLLLLLPRN